MSTNGLVFYKVLFDVTYTKGLFLFTCYQGTFVVVVVVVVGGGDR